MNVDLGEIADVICWLKQILTYLGLWPPDRKDFIFAFYIIYLLVHLSLAYAGLAENFGNLERQLCMHLDAMEEDSVEENYRTQEEKKAFMSYMSQARIFVKLAMPLTFFIAITYYLRPITGQLGAILHGNATITYEMPYKTRLFFEVTNIRTYILTYIYQVPIVFVVAFGFTGIDCLVVTLILHICGQLSVLALRVNDIPNDPRGFHHAIRIFVKRHHQLIRMARSMNNSLSLVLLGQVIGLSLLIALNGFIIIVNSLASQTAHLYVYFLYVLAAIFALYGYCFIGECLIHESTRLQDSFYNIDEWYNIPPANLKLFLICMAQARQPLILTAGKFFLFSLISFKDVMKTSMAYISLLRSFL